MKYEGTVYRPPSEARSLIVQVTIGCSHNRCSFCTMYKDKKFRIRNMEEIKKDFYEASDLYGSQIEKIFLADGNALVLPAEEIKELLVLIRMLFPRIKSVTSYGAPKDILRHSLEDLKMLHKEGLSIVYMGAESGDSQVLSDVEKGVTREEIIEAGKKIKEAEIKSSITLISGLGGKARLKEHAVNSADLISQIKPDYLGFLTLLLEEEAPMWNEIRAGKLELLEPEDVCDEMEIFLSNVDSQDTIFRANHASNHMILKGVLNEDIPRMLNETAQIKKGKNFRHENWRGL
ncbi:MAG: radical SAM protein [Anaerocolumna sp.]